MSKLCLTSQLGSYALCWVVRTVLVLVALKEDVPPRLGDDEVHICTKSFGVDATGLEGKLERASLEPTAYK